jgi:hypothetical protein
MQMKRENPKLERWESRSACCKTGCIDCWSCYSAESFFILKM